MKRQIVVLEIETDDDVADPADWDWRVLIEAGHDEVVEVIATGPVELL